MAFLDFCYRTVVLYYVWKFLKYAQFIIFTRCLQILNPSRTCMILSCLSNIYQEIPKYTRRYVNLKGQCPFFQETLNEKKAAAGNTHNWVILKLCLIKYELDINIYNLKTDYFSIVVFLQKCTCMTCTFLLKENIKKLPKLNIFISKKTTISFTPLIKDCNPSKLYFLGLVVQW